MGGLDGPDAGIVACSWDGIHVIDPESVEVTERTLFADVHTMTDSLFLNRFWSILPEIVS